MLMLLRFFSWTRGLDRGWCWQRTCCWPRCCCRWELLLTAHFVDVWNGLKAYTSLLYLAGETITRARTHLVVGRSATRARERRDSSLARGLERDLKTRFTVEKKVATNFTSLLLYSVRASSKVEQPVVRKSKSHRWFRALQQRIL